MKSAARVARSIEADIVARGCPVGELIGSEAELMRTYQVGRGAIRQAVRILEDRQLVRPREGRSGGLQISVPDLEGVAASVRIFLLHGETRAEHLHDIWSVLVIGAVGDLARDITPTQAADLRTAWRHLAPGEAPKATTEWSPVALHTEILTRLGGPPALLVLVALLEAWRPRLVGAEAVTAARQSTDRTLLAILRGDAGGAEGELRAFFEAHPAPAFGPLKISKSRPAADDKLGRRVAEQLLDEIRGRGWPVGERLGTEAEIQLRLGVSRAALREAVRLLESWSVVEARRGNGGGVVVVAPDPLALRDAARAWLDHAGTSRSAVFAARAPLEVLAVRTLMRTLNQTTVDRLYAVLEEERATGPTFVTGGPDASRPSLSTEIARLSGNPAVALFVPVLVDLVRVYGLRVDHPAKGARWVGDQHRDLVDAISARDAARAELLMRRYVAAVERVAPTGLSRPN